MGSSAPTPVISQPIVEEPAQEEEVGEIVEKLDITRSRVYREYGLVRQLERLLCRVEEGFCHSAFKTYGTAAQYAVLEKLTAGLYEAICKDFMEKEGIAYVPDVETGKDGTVKAVPLPEEKMAKLLGYIQTQAFGMFPVIEKLEKTLSGIGILNQCVVIYLGGDTPNYIKVFNVTAYVMQRFMSARIAIARKCVEWSKRSVSTLEEDTLLLGEQFKNYEEACVKEQPINQLMATTLSFIVECPRHMAIVPTGISPPPEAKHGEAVVEDVTENSTDAAMAD